MSKRKYTKMDKYAVQITALRNERRTGKEIADELGFHIPRKHIQSYRITPSMSRKGNPYNNAMTENFFSLLKAECIQTKTGVAPLTLRHSA